MVYTSINIVLILKVAVDICCFSYFSVENFVFTKRTIRFRNTKYLVRRRKILKSYTCIVTLSYVLYVY